MSDNGFNSIAQAMLKQKQMMDELEYENRQLRREIADIRAGHGIFIEVAGQRFPLRGEITGARTAPATNAIQQDFPVASTTASLPEVPVSQVDESEKLEEIVEAAPTMELSPAVDTTSVEKEKAPTFLEEIMLDEFVAASTSPMSVWKGPVNKQEEPIDEEEKAALRRELMGSFLLE